MVQILTDEFGGSVFGRLGKGIGKGLSEQLPKEIERSRLSSSLKDIAGRSREGKLDPLGVFTETAGAPGITPQHLYTLGPLLNQMQQKRNFLDRGSQSGAGPQAPPQQGIQSPQQASDQGMPAQQISQDITAPMPNSGFASPSQITNYKKSILQEPSFDQVNSLAKDYLNQGITQDPGEATNLARQELTQNRVAQQERSAAIRTNLTDRLSRALQGGGLNDYKDIAGEIQNSLLDQGEYMVNQLGLTPEAASEQLSSIATDLGKTVNKLKDTGSFTNMFKSAKEKETALRTQKKDFEKYGYGELFDDMAAAELGITPLQAAHVLSPLKNKEVDNILDKTKKLSKKSTTENIEPKTLDKLIKSIKPKDNLFSIEYKLREKGLDLQQFKRRILELEEAGEIALTPQQKRQQERAVSESFLGDLLFQAL